MLPLYCPEQQLLASSSHVGTCSFTPIRDAAGTPFVALRSAAQRHRFNQPYQLGTGSRDRAADAQEFLFYVRHVNTYVACSGGSTLMP